MANSNQHDLDRELDLALAKYAAVEPRAGLEERLLANLRSAPASQRAWWQWSAVAAVTAVVIVAISLTWRSGKPTQPAIAEHPAPVAPRMPESRTASNGKSNDVRPHALHPSTLIHRPRAQVVAAAPPKLDQFPAPLPLNEQEKILASYVVHYPEHAVLVAEARAEAQLQDQEEEARTHKDFQQPNR